MPDTFSPTTNHARGAMVGGTSSDEDKEQIILRLDPVTKRLLVTIDVDVITDGTAVNGDTTGFLVLGTDTTNYQVLRTDTDGHLQVDVLSGGGGGTQYTEGDTDASITGTALLFEGAADTLVAAPGTAADGLLVNLGSNNDVTVAGVSTSAKQDTIIGHVDGIEGLLTTIDADTGSILLDTNAIKTAVEIIDNAIAGSEMQVDVVSSALPTGASTLAEQQSQTTHLATIAGDTSAIETAIQIMDDWDNAASDGASVSGDVAHDSADAGEPVKIGFRAFSPDGTTPGTAVAENDRTNAKGDLDGRLFTNPRHPRWWSFHSDGSSALTDQSVQADPGDGFEIVITEIIFSTGAATACNIFFEEGSTKILGPWYLEATAGRGVVWRGEKHVTASTALTVTTSAAIAQSLDVQGYIQAV